MSLNLQNRVVLVTGAADGSGRAIALMFAAAGARVVVADRHQSSAQQVVDEILETGGQAFALGFDVTAEAQVSAAIEFTVAAWSTVDILINTASVPLIKPLQSFSYLEWRTIMAVHLDGAFLMTRACLPTMYAQNRGCIIYLGSEPSVEAAMFKAPYAAAMYGIMGLCRAVAKEGAEHGVRANVIREPEVVRNVMLRANMKGGFTSERDIAEVALMFASHGSNALTGQSLIVSHGWCME
jgi:3-hydroxybutyrate dehydrogenase